MRIDRRVGGYLPLSAYGLIGDCRSAALVGADGSLDWLCLPRFDDASLFGRILDNRKGGHWRVGVDAAVTVKQQYRDLSNVLLTVARTATGRVMVTDFMPISADTLAVDARPWSGPRVVRLVTCLGGEVEIVDDVQPAPDFAREGDALISSQGRLHADIGGLHVCVRASVPLERRTTHHRLRTGETIAFSLSVSHPGECPDEPMTEERARALLRETLEFWWRWAGGIRYEGPYHDAVYRSALALKLMTYAPTGAIVAAPTCSLPEGLGGGRNWDYRFTWLRDASFTLFAFFQLGLTEEAGAFFQWMARLGRHGRRSVDNLYTLDGERTQGEIELHNLTGYRRSRPVRVGNLAAQQLQLDVFGEVLDSAYLFVRFGGSISGALWKELSRIVELAIARWEEPDASIWEVRGVNQHFTYSKVMCWVAVDRGLRIAERFSLPHDAERWRGARRAIHRRVIAEGWNEKLGAFAQTLGGDTCDAALLRMSQVRFLEASDPRMRRNVDVIGERLRDGELVRRYDTEETDDGVGGDEGAFLMCSFWLADAKAHFGELEEAQRLFEQLLAFTSPLGLLSEEADAKTGELLGNYPQAFTHLALVGAAVNIERARHRSLGVHGLGAAARRRR